MRTTIRSVLDDMLMFNARSNRLLLHLLRLRITKQSTSQKAETIPMATLDYGGMGYRNG